MNLTLPAYPRIGLFEDIHSNGVSAEATLVGHLFKETRDHFWSSRSLGSSREESRNQLIDAYREAASEGWDGYGAHKVEPTAILNGFAFIDSLPGSIPMPEVSVDPDGEVSFDWFSAPRRQFSISVGTKNVLSYAGLFGSDKVAGSERFQGTVPGTLQEYIRRVAT